MKISLARRTPGLTEKVGSFKGQKKKENGSERRKKKRDQNNGEKIGLLPTIQKPIVRSTSTETMEDR